jgi:hypothetical protein
MPDPPLRSPTKQQMGAPMRIGDGCSFNSFRTSAYKLHYLESPSGLKAGRARLSSLPPRVAPAPQNLSHLSPRPGQFLAHC